MAHIPHEEWHGMLEALTCELTILRAQITAQDQRIALWRSHWQLCGGFPVREAPLVTLHRAWDAVAPDERRQFLLEELTPQERSWLHGQQDTV